MADIIKIDLTDVQDTLQGTFQRDFELTDYTDSPIIELAAGTVEEVGGFIYRVEGGDIVVADSGVINGTVYIEVSDDGDGTASAEVSATSGTWDPNLRGYYKPTGEKTIFAMVKSAGPTYSDKFRISVPFKQRFQDIQVTNNAIVLGDVIADHLVKRQVFTSGGTWTRPENVDYARVICVGGGGGGGQGQTNGGGGGGAAGQITDVVVNVTDASYSVTIGTGGTATNDGTDTTFGSLVTGSGGAKGTNSNPGVQGGDGGQCDTFGASDFGAGGVGVNAAGAPARSGSGGGAGHGTEDGASGGVGFNGNGGTGGTEAGSGGGGGGGAGYNGNGGNGASDFHATGSTAGTGFGSGGGGGSGGSTAGAAGTAGICIVEWSQNSV